MTTILMPPTSSDTCHDDELGILSLLEAAAEAISLLCATERLVPLVLRVTKRLLGKTSSC